MVLSIFVFNLESIFLELNGRGTIGTSIPSLIYLPLRFLLSGSVIAVIAFESQVQWLSCGHVRLRHNQQFGHWPFLHLLMQSVFSFGILSVIVCKQMIKK